MYIHELAMTFCNSSWNKIAQTPNLISISQVQGILKEMYSMLFGGLLVQTHNPPYETREWAGMPATQSAQGTRCSPEQTSCSSGRKFRGLMYIGRTDTEDCQCSPAEKVASRLTEASRNIASRTQCLWSLGWVIWDFFHSLFFNWSFST